MYNVANDYECDIEFCGKTSILYQEAIRRQPVDAKAAYKKEILKVIKKEEYSSSRGGPQQIGACVGDTHDEKLPRKAET
jgi:hypothetical protein